MSTRVVSLFLLMVVLFGLSTAPILFAEAAPAAPDVQTTPEMTSQAVQTPFHAEPIQVQQALTQAGFFTGKVDGIIGKKTRAAIRAFQEANGLTVDGRCGPLTWEKLKPYASEAVPASSDLTVSETDNTLVEEIEQSNPTGHELKQKLVS